MASLVKQQNQNPFDPEGEADPKSNLRIRKFHFPHEHGAWWTFMICMAAGAAMALLSGSDWPTVVLLALPMLAVFMVSDWISALAGSFLDEKKGADLTAWQPWVLLAGAALSAGLFLWRLPPDQLSFWVAAFVAQGALIILMFLLRQELHPRDFRLLLMSTALLTAPALFLGALALGWKSLKLWEFWLWPALYFTAGVLYVKGWVNGRLSRGLRLTSAVAPYLALAVVAALAGRWLAVLLFITVALRATWRMGARLRGTGDHIPPFKAIKRFGYEQVALSFIFATIWIATFLGPTAP